MDKSLLSRRALVNLTLSGTFLFPMETPLSVKELQRRGDLAAVHAVAGTRPSNEASPNAAMVSTPAASATACPEVFEGPAFPFF